MSTELTMKRFLLALAFMMPAASLEAAELSRDYIAVEGPRNAALNGTWHIEGQGEHVHGKATMWDAAGLALSFAVEGRIDGQTVSLRRTKSSDDRSCLYLGTIAHDGSITGTAVCNNQQSAWTLTAPPTR
jgi:hypothetical protein